MFPYATSTRSKKVFQYARSVKKQQNRAAGLLKKTYRLLVSTYFENFKSPLSDVTSFLDLSYQSVDYPNSVLQG